MGEIRKDPQSVKNVNKFARLPDNSHVAFFSDQTSTTEFGDSGRLGFFLASGCLTLQIDCAYDRLRLLRNAIAGSESSPF